MFNVEIKSDGEYSMTSMKGLFFQRIMEKCGSASPLCWKYFISIVKTGFFY